MVRHSIPVAHRSTTPPAVRRVLLEGQRDQIVSLLMLLTAIALFVAPWVVGEPDTAKDAHRNELGVGMVVLFIALARFRWHLGLASDVVILLAGGWLIASPWLLGLRNTAVFDGAQVFDVAAGTVLVVLSVVSMLLLRRAEKLERGGGRSPDR
ncbi:MULTISPECIES: SPW repeat protein [unclassified Streptomyces]|uniref:SPW repeat domain-containing protein n=1 Tax=unclassified Streptomyces TaxID=2593676 RepID=UPI0033BBBC39